MEIIKVAYFLTRRYFFLDDDEVFHEDDYPWLFIYPVIIALILTMCIVTVMGNYK